MSLVTPMSRVLGLGSAKDGVEHWWRQRLTAAALLVLSAWFVVGIVMLDDASYAGIVAWLSHPVSAVLMLLMVATLCYHSHLGVQVVIEDYVHARVAKTLLLVLVTFAHFALAAAGLFALVKVALGA
jgi:succinate dehydrogenase / fumarate reductase membrane anchor subunit